MMNIPPKTLKKNVLLSGMQVDQEVIAAVAEDVLTVTEETAAAPAKSEKKATLKPGLVFKTAHVEKKTGKKDAQTDRQSAPFNLPDTKTDPVEKESTGNDDSIKSEHIIKSIYAHGLHTSSALKKIPKSGTGSVPAHQNQMFGIQKTPESLPVLEAFQEFLDSEHRKMRRRMFALSMFFILIILAMVGGGSTAGYFYLMPMLSEVKDMRIAMAEMKESTINAKSSTEATVGNFGKMLAEEKQALSEAQSEIARQVNSHDGNIRTVTDSVAGLKNESSELRKDIGEIRQDWSGLSAQVREIMREIEKMKNTQTIATAPPPSDAASPAVEPEVKGLELTFIPKGGTETVTCLVSIPE